MARYLKDRRNGELYGWNHEMAKLPYMLEGDHEDKDFNNGEPDPTYVEGDSGFPVYEELDLTSNTEQAAATGYTDFGDAAQQGADALDGDDVVVNPAPVLNPEEPPWAVDMNNSRLYSEEDEPLVYVLGEDGAPTVDDTGAVVLEVYREPEVKKTSKKK